MVEAIKALNVAVAVVAFDPAKHLAAAQKYQKCPFSCQTKQNMRMKKSEHLWFPELSVTWKKYVRVALY